MSDSFIQIALNKAKRTPCHYKVCAIGFNRRGEYLGMMTNRPRFNRHGGGEHAEIRLIRRYGSRVRSILLVRSTNTGKLSSIDPCPVCAKIMSDLGITCKTVR